MGYLKFCDSSFFTSCSRSGHCQVIRIKKRTPIREICSLQLSDVCDLIMRKEIWKDLSFAEIVYTSEGAYYYFYDWTDIFATYEDPTRVVPDDAVCVTILILRTNRDKYEQYLEATCLCGQANNAQVCIARMFKTGDPINEVDYSRHYYEEINEGFTKYTVSIYELPQYYYQIQMKMR